MKKNPQNREKEPLKPLKRPHQYLATSTCHPILPTSARMEGSVMAASLAALAAAAAAAGPAPPAAPPACAGQQELAAVVWYLSHGQVGGHAAAHSCWRGSTCQRLQGCSGCSHPHPSTALQKGPQACLVGTQPTQPSLNYWHRLLSPPKLWSEVVQNSNHSSMGNSN